MSSPISNSNDLPWVQNPSKVATYSKIAMVAAAALTVLMAIAFVGSVVALSPVGIVVTGLALAFFGILTYDLYKISEAASGLTGKGNTILGKLEEAITNNKAGSFIDAYARDTILVKRFYNLTR